MTIVEEIEREKEQFEQIQKKAKLVLELVTERIRLCNKIGLAQKAILSNLVSTDVPLYSSGGKTTLLTKDGLRWKMNHEKVSHGIIFGLSNKDLWDFVSKKEIAYKFIKPEKQEILKKYLEKMNLLEFTRPEETKVEKVISAEDEWSAWRALTIANPPLLKILKMNLAYYRWPSPENVNAFISMEQDNKQTHSRNISLNKGTTTINELSIIDQLFPELNEMLDKEIIQKGIEIENTKLFYNDISEKFADILYLSEIEKGDEKNEICL